MKPTSVHIIQNDFEVPPGSITGCLARYGVPFQLLQPYKDDPLPEADAISALIVLGGGMGANDDLLHPFLAPLKDLIRDVALAGTPYLGICLGGQLLAAALGATVARQRWQELGMGDITLTQQGGNDPLFAGIDSPFVTFQWHHDSFDLPSGATLLASSRNCPNQAFRAGPAAWGLQFHPEVTTAIIRDWCAWDPETAARTEEILAAFNANEQAYGITAQALVRNFLQQTGMPRA